MMLMDGRMIFCAASSSSDKMRLSMEINKRKQQKIGTIQKRGKNPVGESRGGNFFVEFCSGRAGVMNE
jgi:hypothetical protein